jgi:hypothetical protein
VKRLALVALAALVAAAPAHGKELTRAVVCGADGCNTITERDELRTLIVSGDQTLPPPAPGRFYSVELGTRDDVQDYTWTIWYAPAAKAIAVINESRDVAWHPVENAAGFERTSRGLTPFPRPRVTSVRIGTRVITEGAGSYLRLFTQPVAGGRGDASLNDWVDVDLRSARPTPWTVGAAEFSFSANAGLLERSWQLVALPEATADAIAAGHELPVARSGGRSVPWPVVAAALALVAALPLLVRRRRPAIAVGGATLALVLAAPAHAKFPITLRLSDATPRVGQQIRVAVSIPARYAAGADMRLVAVPPRMGMYEAIKSEERHGVSLAKRGTTWRGIVRFRRPGRWLLVVPNWGAPGYALPPPVIRKVRVGA